MTASDLHLDAMRFLKERARDLRRLENDTEGIVAAISEANRVQFESALHANELTLIVVEAIREVDEAEKRAHRPSSAIGSSPLSPTWDEGRTWPLIDETAFHGLTGEFVRAVAPMTEADRAALLFSLLAMIGNIAGQHKFAKIHADEHPARLSVVLIGATSSGGKGTSSAVLRPLVMAIDPDWTRERMQNGFGSGEAVVATLGVASSNDGTADVLPDASADHRCFAQESEFSRMLTVASRDGSTLSAILRNAWDGNPLQVRRSKDRVVATNHHISILGHITPDELRQKLGVEASNGFANRFLYVACRRSQKLPFGGDIPDRLYTDFAARFKHALGPATSRQITFASEAKPLWEALYRSECDRDGIVGELTARSAAQRLRLAVAYAIIDGSHTIRLAHVAAAEACWRYSVDSVNYIFGNMRSDATAQTMLAALQSSYPEGLERARLHELFNRNVPAARITAAIRQLVEAGLARTSSQPTNGRPQEITHAIPKLLREKAPLISLDSYISSKPDKKGSYAEVPLTPYENNELRPLCESYDASSTDEIYENNELSSRSGASVGIGTLNGEDL